MIIINILQHFAAVPGDSVSGHRLTVTTTTATSRLPFFPLE